MQITEKKYYYQPKNPRNMIVPRDKSYDSVVPNLIRTAQIIAKNSEDYVVNNPAAHGMRFDAGHWLSFKFGRGTEAFAVRDFATHQLCQKLKMPPAFFDYLVSSAGRRDIAYLTVNRLLSLYEEDMFIRTCSGQIRGILTPKYQCFDTDRILDVFTSCFESNQFISKDDIHIKGYVNNMERFHIRFTNAEPIKGVPDHDIEYGLQIDSSDVGKSSIKVRFMIYKQVCTNGLTIGYLDKELFQHNHVGKITPDEFQRGLKRSFELFPRIAAKATEIINSSDGYSLEDSGLLDFTKSDDASQKERKNMQLFLGVGEDSLKAIAKIADASYRPTSWGYVNAITEYSQRFEFERRAELERLAGQIIKEPEKFFRKAA